MHTTNQQIKIQENKEINKVTSSRDRDVITHITVTWLHRTLEEQSEDVIIIAEPIKMSRPI